MPTFVDYLYLSFTNSTAFSPTDTLPLTPIAKMLMLAQSDYFLAHCGACCGPRRQYIVLSSGPETYHHPGVAR